MTQNRNRRINNVTPGLLAIDIFAARPKVIDRTGRDITDDHPEPEWSAFRARPEPSGERGPMRYGERVRLIGPRLERDRKRRQHKKAQRRSSSSRIQPDAETLREIRRTFKKARRHVESAITKIHCFLRHGQTGKARNKQRLLLSSFYGKLMAFEKVNNRL